MTFNWITKSQILLYIVLCKNYIESSMSNDPREF
uniref:Uncharacterized protein n=1 Tax=Rhizophora mucronata TaxID=61149 RepID=A0A2P2L075_RHIMU